MVPPRRLAMLSSDQLARLTKSRLLAYRKTALSLENSPEDSDYSSDEVKLLDKSYLWFKSDPRWHEQYELILKALANR